MFQTYHMCGENSEGEGEWNRQFLAEKALAGVFWPNLVFSGAMQGKSSDLEREVGCEKPLSPELHMRNFLLKPEFQKKSFSLCNWSFDKLGQLLPPSYYSMCHQCMYSLRIVIWKNYSKQQAYSQTEQKHIGMQDNNAFTFKSSPQDQPRKC